MVHGPNLARCFFCKLSSVALKTCPFIYDFFCAMAAFWRSCDEDHMACRSLLLLSVKFTTFNYADYSKGRDIGN